MNARTVQIECNDETERDNNKSDSKYFRGISMDKITENHIELFEKLGYPYIYVPEM